MYAIEVTGDDTEQIYATEEPIVHVSYPGAEGGQEEYGCQHCDAATDVPPTTGERCDGMDCAECYGVGEDDAGTQCATCDGSGHGEHDWQLLAHSWINSAGIRSNGDSVTVTISVGDPRGAFAMTVERMDDGTLRLSVPHVADSAPHMGLVPLRSPGYYQIVPSESPEHVAARAAARERVS